MAILLFCCAAPAVSAQGGARPEPAAEEIENCLGCHEDPGIEIEFADGTRRSLRVDREAFASSVHGRKLRCSDCHPGSVEIPHPERRWKDADEFRAGLREACKSCHFANYTRYLDSVHYRVLSEKGPAPSCVDCHDSHAIAPPDRPRTRISDTCSACHSEISEIYAKSVHGRELAGKNGVDVPVCTDCHHTHDIVNPHEAEFLLRTPEMCGRCHADAKRMAKYGISTDVLQTYLSDFHGMTASLARPTAKGEVRVTAVCVDCHGFHDIARVDEPGSRVLKANLVRTCRQCHPGATDNFPAAWLSHFEPSLSKAPLVYLVKVFYAVFIPFVIGGLVLQILLHVWRVAVNR
jgi:nitrate/TMAO reductase-like tetraheme cytochrome c subunit